MTDTMTNSERFMLKVRKIESGCWIWTGSLNAFDYGTFRDGEQTCLAHRWSFEHLGHNSPAPELHHTCRVRACVNFAHVVPTEKDSHPDKPSVLNKLKQCCPSGHPYQGDNLYTDPSGARHCRICRNQASLKSYHKNWKQNRDSQRVYYAKNRERIQAQRKLKKHSDSK